MMGRAVGIAGFVALGVALLALGTTQDVWWTLLGGVSSLAAAAWWITEAPEDA